MQSGMQSLLYLVQKEMGSVSKNGTSFWLREVIHKDSASDADCIDLKAKAHHVCIVGVS